MRRAESGLREQKKAATRARVLEVSAQLFAARGFDGASLDAICAEAGISKRTFFRYFDDKEALVFRNWRERLNRFRALLEAADPQEPLFRLLRRLGQRIADESMRRREAMLRGQQLMAHSSALRAREREIDREWEKVFAEGFRRRLPASDRASYRAEVLAGAMIGTLRATLRYWYAGECSEDLGDLAEQALAALEGGFTVSGPTA